MVALDKLDRNLLYELNWNCRQTNNEIAKKFGTSKQVVAYRIKKLGEQKIISGYNALIDWRKLGYNALRIYIKWRNINPELESKIYEEIRKDPMFMWTVKFEGDFSCGLYVWSRDIVDFSKKWNNFFEKYKKYILNFEYYESISMIHYPMKFLNKKKVFQEKVIGLKGVAGFDDKDFEILSYLSFNARVPIIDLEEKLGLTSKAIIYRIRNMEHKGIILGYNAIIDFEKIGLKFYKIDFYLNDFSMLEEMYSFAKNHNNIVYVMETFGGPDFEIEVFVENTTELNKIIEEVRTNFSKVIEYYRFHHVSHTIKQVYLPGQLIEKGKVVRQAEK